MPLPQKGSALRRARTAPRLTRGRVADDAALFLPRKIPTYEALREYSQKLPDFEMDPDSLTAHLSLLHVMAELLARSDAYFATHGLSRGRFSVLVSLLFLGAGGMSPSALAEQTNVTRATITGLLDGLERDELVRREKSGDDRRRLVVRLTPRAEELMRAFLPVHFKRVKTLMGRLTREEKHELVRLLGKVSDGIPDVEKML